MSFSEGESIHFVLTLKRTVWILAFARMTNEKNFILINMRLSFTKIIFTVVLVCSGAIAQDLCPHFLLEKDLVVNIEGRFVNESKSRTSMDIQWRHHPEALDTFYVSFPNAKPFSFITAGEFRYMEFESPKIKRQLGLHHLRETIGNTPLKLDDLELLANGSFLCKDTTEQPANVLSTAFSNTWWSMTLNRLDEPDSIAMRGAFKESRLFKIGQWKDFSGTRLPTLVKLSNDNYQGEIWVRSAYPTKALEDDPMTKRYKGEFNGLFRKVPGEGKRKIPLILKLNQELLRN